MTPTPTSGRSCPSADAPVSWYYPDTEGDNRQLQAWCVTVGPTVVSFVPDAHFGTLQRGDTLTIAVWNSNVGAGDLQGFLKRELGLRCSASASSLDPGAPQFALLVQEAFRRSADIPTDPPGGVMPPAVAEEPRPGPRTDTIEIAEECGLSLVYVAAARNGSQEREGMREDKGVAILSTLPLSDVIGIELPFEASRRVAIAATVHDAGGDSLRLVNVHFISSAGPARVLTTGNDSRPRQAAAAVDALRRAEAERAGGLPELDYPMSTVLAGDLNTWSDAETALLQLREYFPDSPPPLEVPTRGRFPTDHLLFRSSGTPGSPRLLEGSYQRIEDRYNSDHHAVLARVVFDYE